MKTRKLGNSPLHLTPVGLGTWAIGGGDWKFGWGAQDDALPIRPIHEAMAGGITWTAPPAGDARGDRGELPEPSTNTGAPATLIRYTPPHGGLAAPPPRPACLHHGGTARTRVPAPCPSERWPHPLGPTLLLTPTRRAAE